MRLLLDTHTLLWAALDSAQLSSLARDALLDSSHERYISDASLFEIAVKMSIGKLQLAVGFRELVHGAEEQGLRRLGPVDAHFERLSRLPLHHRDPFDRLLIAQAQAESMTILTVDPAFARYDVRITW